MDGRLLRHNPPEHGEYIPGQPIDDILGIQRRHLISLDRTIEAMIGLDTLRGDIDEVRDERLQAVEDRLSTMYGVLLAVSLVVALQAVAIIFGLVVLA